jgi:hypothetical protein
MIELKSFRFSHGLLTFSTDSDGSMSYILYDVIVKLIPAGIPQYLMNHHSNVFERQTLNNNELGFFKVLCLSDCMFLFILWICGCGLSAVILLMELKGFLFQRTY